MTEDTYSEPNLYPDAPYDRGDPEEENNEPEMMSADEMVSALRDLMDMSEEIEDLHSALKDYSTTTFSNGGYLTDDAGFVIRLANGQEFRVTVIRSR